MTPAEIQVKINLAQKEADFWRSILADKRCGNCASFTGRECEKFQAAPPQGRNEPGCEEWKWDDIPFN